MSPVLAQTQAGWLEGYLVRLFDLGPVGPVVAAGLVVASFGVGAAHALAPGHGKAVIAAYLVGDRGRARDAFALGAVVSAMHTASVVAVGVGIAVAARASAQAGRVAGADAGAWMALTAGVLVTVVGAALLLRHRRRPRAGRGAHHSPSLPPGVRPLSRRGLVLLGLAGGLLPSPSAFLVLTTGLATGRTSFAVVLVAAFSLGLAATLTAVGLAALWGRDRLVDRLAGSPRLARVHRALPVVSAALILLAGAAMTTAAAIALR